MNIRAIIISIFVAMTALPAYADHYSHRSPKMSAGISFEQLYLNEDIANEQLVGDTASAINLDFNIGNGQSYEPNISFGLGASMVFFNDNGEFSQEVVDDYGHLYNAGSDAEAVHLYFEGGPNLPIGRYSRLTFKGGYTLPVYSERSIDRCKSCFSEDIEIDGGFYGQAGFRYDVGHVSLNTEYKYYLDEDNGIEDTFSFGISGQY